MKQPRAHCTCTHRSSRPRLQCYQRRQMQWKSLPIVVATVLVGILFRGTGHRTVVEPLLEELVSRPNNRVTENREAHALSAGLGLGLACLGCGESLPGLSDLRVLDTLNSPLSLAVPSFLHASSASSTSKPSSNGTKLDASSKIQHPSLVETNKQIDVGVTAPGAIIALALMFLGMSLPHESSSYPLRMPNSKTWAQTTLHCACSHEV